MIVEEIIYFDDVIDLKPAVAKVRRDVVKQLNRGMIIILDFEHLKTISYELADELFGKLNLHHGLDRVADKICVVNYTEEVDRVIAQVFHDRVSQISFKDSVLKKLSSLGFFYQKIHSGI